MLLNPFKTKSSAAVGGRHGTLGVDIGSSAIKMVRMERISGRWKIINRLSLPIEEESLDLKEELQCGFLRRQLEILQKRNLSAYHDCACVLPMSVTDLRSVEVPPGGDKEVQQMATEALRDAYQNDFDNRITKLWRHSETPHDMAMVTGISVRTELGEAIVSDLNEVNFDCRSMTSLPFALCQAASMSPVGRSQRPIGLLSWEHSGTTLVIARKGRPEFIRSLRGCTGQAVLQRLADGMGLTFNEARCVLATVGVPGIDGRSNTLAKAVEQIIQPEIHSVVNELQKTLMYLRHHMSRLMPGRLVLFGGMATVANIDKLLQTSSGLETRCWSLNAENSHVSDPVYAPAIAASAGVTVR